MADADADDNKVQQFMTVTGVDEERARFYMESSAGQLEVALASFYENDSEPDVQEIVDTTIGDEAIRRRRSQRRRQYGGADLDDDDVEEVVVGAGTDPASSSAMSPSLDDTSQTRQKKKTKSKQRQTRFGTVHTLNASSSSDDDDDDSNGTDGARGSRKKKNNDDEEEGQAFYAGGSEHSGQQVLGPPRRDIVADMFKSVREHGVEIIDTGASSSAANNRRHRYFGGTGYKLGQTDDDTVAIVQPGANRGRGGGGSGARQVTLKLWRDGFSVDRQRRRERVDDDGPTSDDGANDDIVEGELRPYADAANREFLECIRRGEIPPELREGGAEIHLSMEDHRAESFGETRSATNRRGGGVCNHRRRPFAGQGHVLGNPTPPIVGATREEDRAVNEANARRLLHVDPSRPVTNLQIRLADGSRLVGQFNHDHTVAQVRGYIRAARPQYETRDFALLSAYPSRELDDDKQTLVDAGILNSAIMQKLV